MPSSHPSLGLSVFFLSFYYGKGWVKTDTGWKWMGAQYYDAKWVKKAITRLGALLSSPALDVRLMTALQVLQVPGCRARKPVELGAWESTVHRAASLSFPLFVRSRKESPTCAPDRPSKILLVSARAGVDPVSSSPIHPKRESSSARALSATGPAPASAEG